jgi:hypothetical protein
MRARWIMAPSLRRRRRTLAVLLMLLGAMSAAVVVFCETEWALGPWPTGVGHRITQRVYTWDDAVLDSLEAAARVRQRWLMSSTPSAREDLVQRSDKIGVADVDVGYVFTPEGGPSWAPRIMWREEVWQSVRTSVAGDLDGHKMTRALTPEEQDQLAGRMLTRLFANSRLASVKPRVTAIVPVRTWINARGTAASLAWPLAIVSPALAIALFILDRIVRSRKRLIAGGLCPGCLYEVYGSNQPRCPECSEAFTTYEQTILAAQIRSDAP